MSTNAKVTNLLLGIIALCLCLIVFDLYGVGQSAYAQASSDDVQRVEVSNDALSVDVGNVPLPVELVAREPLRVQLYYNERGTWQPVTLDAGALVVRPR